MFKSLLFLSVLLIASSSSVPPDWDPNSPTDILCQQLPERFHHCFLEQDSCIDWMESYTSKPIAGTSTCHVPPDIRCEGPRVWSSSLPCIKTNGKRYPTLVFLSTLAGIFGADRFYLGQIGLGVLKLVSLGGLGVWWLIDMIILVNNGLCPNGNCIFEYVF
ncbi:hypothetical protein P9112_012581 [Eukaryota sp. TZLM1-RC]